MKSLKKKILITAGNSKIGNDLINYFLKKNYFVFTTYRKKKSSITHKRLIQVRYSFENEFNIKNNFDLFIHCASLTPNNFKVSKKMIDLNVQGLSKILNSDSNFKKIILFSTLSVYGSISSGIVNEKTKKKNVSNYGISKIKMEIILKNFCKRSDINYLILRLPGVIGNFKTKNSFLNNLIKNLSENKRVFYKNPNVYFNNVVHTSTISNISNEFLLKKEPIYSNKIFNLCSSNPIKLIQIIEMIKNKLKSKSKLIVLKSSHSFQISSKKCLKYKLKIINTKSSINKIINFYVNHKLFYF